MSTQQPWEVDLADSAKQFMNEVIEQIPETGGARAAFVMILNRIAAPTKEVQSRLDKLQALENGGVDNWDGYDWAMEELQGDANDDD